MSQTLNVAASVPATSTTANVLSGQTIEWQGKAAVLTLYGNAGAAGLTHTLYMNDGQTVVTVVPPNSSLGIGSTVGKIKVNEDFILQYAIPAGMRLVHSVSNSTAGAVIGYFQYVIT